MLRAQVTNSTLFTLPGGDAGLAVVAEFGKQDWQYDPDPGFLDGSIWGQTDVSGGGERDRYAVTTELRMPVWSMLTVTASGRYDSFKASGRTIDKPTYSLGLEFRPIESLLIPRQIRHRFPRAHPVGSLPGPKRILQLGGRLHPVRRGRVPAGTSRRLPGGNIPLGSTSAPSPAILDLKPIDADVWSVGLVWAPVDRFSLTVDYHNWDIKDEVTQQSANGLTCRNTGATSARTT